MSGRQHNYSATITWTGNKGQGTNDYRQYERSHTVSIDGKPDLLCSSDVAFRGDKMKHNPEDMLLSALSSCHMLWYLHLCADAGVVVTEYIDNAKGIMEEGPTSVGRFTSVTLNPTVIVTEESMIEKAIALHEPANKKCFIANSVNFEVKHSPIVKVK